MVRRSIDSLKEPKNDYGKGGGWSLAEVKLEGYSRRHSEQVMVAAGPGGAEEGGARGSRQNGLLIGGNDARVSVPKQNKFHA